MKIGITLHPYGETAPAGLAEYILRLSKTLVEVNKNHTFVFFVKGSNQIKPDWLEGTKHEFERLPKSYFWLDKAAKRRKDIDFWIYYTPMLPILQKPKKSLVIALDFGYLHLSARSLKSILLKFLHKRAMKKANRVATISNFTAKEVELWFPEIEVGKIESIFAGYRNLSKVNSERIKNIPDAFFLSVGVLKPRKNQLKTVEGFFLAKKKGLKSSLVICGKATGSYYEKIRATIEASEYKKDVYFTGYVNLTQIVFAYKNAIALVFPTRLEGFGFPVLEAMSLGLPVITSNTNSVGEISGGAALTVNSDSEKEIADAMLKMENEQVREKFIKLGYEQCKKYSWHSTASKLINLIETVK